APVVITECGRDAHRGTETVTLAFLRDGAWASRVVDAVDVADSRAAVGLAAYGVPVTTNNAKLLVQFLSEYQAANRPHLPVAAFSSKMGWQDGMHSFLWGRTLIAAE